MATISSQWCMLVIDYHIEAASIARSLTITTVVFFAYVGFDAVANSAEESRRPQACFVDLWDLPSGIIRSLFKCIALCIWSLFGDQWDGAVAGLTTALLRRSLILLPELTNHSSECLPVPAVWMEAQTAPHSMMCLCDRQELSS
ncbi:hypothetical protein NC653_032443 [Populus alba x Populus x berolinensis]|uniref:Uncharacterized protein n=1 Tax=Populus alba x Populus x berolinensis TaxID=444605 RepID=A0AAD6PY62_9ROSI|nr:hypothetical protein NC653_032443 [Populus alba x Populus x berolinensis]